MSADASTDRRFLISLDAGGTMTDCFLSDENGVGYLGKSLTAPANQEVSYQQAVEDAATAAGLSVEEVHQASHLVTYAGTTLTNIVVEGKGARVGLITPRGFEHYPLIEGAFTYLGQSRTEQANWQLHRHTLPMVDQHDVRGVSERIIGGSPYDAGPAHEAGTVIIPLNETEVEEAVGDLLDNGVQAIAVWFLCSYTNPLHEHKAKAIAERIVAERGLTVPVVASVDLCPRRGETSRLKSTLLEAYGASKTRAQLMRVEQASQSLGAKGDLSTLVSYGAITNVRHPRLYETVVAGPIGGMLGAKALSEVKGWKDVICCDLGGTSYDVGTIINGLTSVENSMDFAGHRLNVSSMQIDSIGAGAGSEIHVDPAFKRVTLGPGSAGSRVGTCYQNDTISVADIDVILGYLPADNFLGGKVNLDVGAARARLTSDLAVPLGMDLHAACAGVLDLLHDTLGDHITGSLVSRGLNPGEYVVLSYGGSGPLHMWGVAERIEARGFATVPWAAAFSAWGISVGESFYRLDQTVNAVLSPNAPSSVRMSEASKVAEAWRMLEKRAISELETMGVDTGEVEFKYGVNARYVGQLFASWSAHVPTGHIRSDGDVDALIESFESEFQRIYPSAGRFPEAGYQFDGAFIEAVVPKIRPAIARYQAAETPPSPVGERQAYWQGEFLPYEIWDMDSLAPGVVVEGPAIIEHSMTTLVVPPGKAIEVDEHLVIWYRSKDERLALAGSASAREPEPVA